MIKVACISCENPYELDERRLPPSGLKMKCPKCGTSFLVYPDGRTAAAPAAPTKPLAPPPPPPRVPPPPPPRAVATALEGLEEDLPAPKQAPGEIDLPAPRAAAPRASQRAMTKVGMGDAKAPKGLLGGDELDLPAPRGAVPKPATAAADDLDLPAPRNAPGIDLDLPAPRSAKAPPTSVRPALAQPDRTPFDDDALDPLSARRPADDLDLPAPRRAPGPLGGIDLDLPAPKGARANDLDLPAPRGAAPSVDLDLPAPKASPRGIDLDLPAPKGGAAAFDLDLPAPKGGGGFDLDLPAPKGGGGGFDLDLPQPSRRGGQAARPLDELDLPAPKGGGMELDLPAPKGGGIGLDLDLPQPARRGAGEVDLPAPVGGGGFGDLDLPQPSRRGGGGEIADLPQPVGFADLPGIAAELPAPAAGLPAPAAGLPRRVRSDLPSPGAPGGLDDLELPPPKTARARPATAELELPLPAARDRGHGEVDLGGDLGGSRDDMEFADIPQESPSRVDAPRPQIVDAPKPGAAPAAAPKPPSRAPLLVGLGAIVLLGGAGAALTFTPYGPFGYYALEQFLPAAGDAAQVAATIQQADALMLEDQPGAARDALIQLGTLRHDAGLNRELLARSLVMESLYVHRFADDMGGGVRAAAIRQRLEERNPDDPMLALALAADQLRQDNPDGATAHLDAARAYRADDPFVDIVAGEAALAREAWPEARAAFQTALSHNGGAMAQWGVARAMIGQTRAARAAAFGAPEGTEVPPEADAAETAAAVVAALAASPRFVGPRVETARAAGSEG
ncbi:MAG: zinc-ribbon domain-containing protein, partial [Sandaracinaceae bacterium]|nr:zinc-ribbon domain-containing protein [Sandaracinaceae bacterium]